MSINAIILLGAPGAGKGTMAEAIRQATEYAHVSTGDMLREAIKAGTPRGQAAERYMAKGELVPDKLIIEMVMERIDREGRKSGRYLFDGFPRTLTQARLLDAEFQARQAVIAKVFLLDVPQETALQRLTGRRICRNCGANFHVQNIPPKKKGVCDYCGGALEQRADDQAATILNRLEVYHQQTAALIAYYKSRGILTRLDSSRPRAETAAELLQHLNQDGSR